MATIVQWVDSAYGWPTPLQIAAGILIAIVALIGLVVAGYTLVPVVVYGSIWHEVRLLGRVVGFLTAISLPLVIVAVLPLGLPDSARLALVIGSISATFWRLHRWINAQEKPGEQRR
jgi:hypothetical protein